MREDGLAEINFDYSFHHQLVNISPYAEKKAD